MKIAFVLDDTLDSTDGVQQYVLLIGAWLLGQGHDVHYLTGQTKRTDIPNIRSLSRNIKVRFNKNRLSIPMPSSTRKLRKLLADEQFDVLHIQMPYSPLLASKIIKNAPKTTAIVGTFHIAPHTSFVSAATSWLGRLERKSLKRFDEIISVSPIAQAFALKTFKIKSSVIPNAVDTTKWMPNKKQIKKKEIVFLGRLVPRKGCIYLLHACKELKDQKVLGDTKIIIAGDGPDRAKLEKYVKENKLSKSVSFVGYISEEHKRKLLQEAHIGVFPSTGGESFGIVLIEAMAAGSVAIAGDNDGYKGVLGSLPDSIIDPTNVEAFTKTLQRLLTEKKMYSDLHRAQAELVKQYDVNVVGDAILKTYKKAVKHKNQSKAKQGK